MCQVSNNENSFSSVDGFQLFLRGENLNKIVKITSREGNRTEAHSCKLGTGFVTVNQLLSCTSSAKITKPRKRKLVNSLPWVHSLPCSFSFQLKNRIDLQQETINWIRLQSLFSHDSKSNAMLRF